MGLYESIASTLIGTPLEAPAEGLRWVSGLPQRIKHPELRELYLEGSRSKALMERTITRSMNCIDIGCHLGSVLNKITRLAPEGRHIAVEPLPYKAGWLRRKYPRVEVHQVALGEEESVLEFFHDPKRSGYSGLKDRTPGTTSVQVQVRRLDDVVPADRKIGYIKLDVEGAEYSVFRGARRVLTESRPVVLFECIPSGFEAFGVTAPRIFTLLVEDFGYQVHLIKDYLAGGPPVDLAKFQSSMVYPFQALNFVASPRGSSAS